jgi:GNAT superfamily N-acetyltransferase
VVGELKIEPVTSRPAADRWHAVAAACSSADHLNLPADPVHEVYERIETARTDQRDELWLGSVGGVPMALCSLSLPLLDNLMTASVDIRVLPSFRRRGHGTTMLAHVIDRARSQGRSRLLSEACEPASTAAGTPPSAGAAFAAGVGARPVTAEVRRLLRIADLDEAELSRLRADAVLRSAGYSLLQWEGSAPDGLVDDLAVLLSRMATDAPLEDMDWEPEHWNAHRYREQEGSIAARGRDRLVTVARHDESGRVVAFSDIGIASDPPEIAYQWSTIVLAEHRGHRLGMLVKLANLEFLRASHPRVETVNTWNAGVNAHMVSINEAIGFRPIERWREWQLELPPKHVAGHRAASGAAAS